MLTVAVICIHVVGHDLAEADAALDLDLLHLLMDHFLDTDGQPMNINFSIISPLEKRIRKKAEKNLAIANRSLEIIDEMVAKGI